MTIPDHFVIAQGSGGDPHAPRQNRAPKASAFASAFEQAIHGLQERSQNFILLRALRYLAVLGWLFWASYGIAQERSLKVGAVLALSGYAAKHSEGIRKGIELAAEKLKGDGWSLDINFQDDQTNPGGKIFTFAGLRPVHRADLELSGKRSPPQHLSSGRGSSDTCRVVRYRGRLRTRDFLSERAAPPSNRVGC
ncbi:MAG: hypothetical protein DCC75_11365 [Proteobacteria bacterium]|nr:MAG: hypothetical protein DCC75_11365 [Pseudomonadota bacterium]